MSFLPLSRVICHQHVNHKQARPRNRGGFFISEFGRPQSKPSSYIPLCSAVYVRRADNLPGLPETYIGQKIGQLYSNREISIMTAIVYQLRDYQNPKDLERLRQALDREDGGTRPIIDVPYNGAGIDGMDLGKDQ